MRRGLVLRRALASGVLLGVPLAFVALLGDLLATPATLRVIVTFLISVVLVVAIQSFTGNSGIVTFGHVGFMGVGAYTAAALTIPPVLKQSMLPSLPDVIATRQLGFLPAVLISAAFTALVAAVLAGALARMQEGAMAMATFAVLVIFFDAFDNWSGVTRGATGLFGVPQSTTVYSALAFAVVAVVIARWFRESDIGMKLRASRADALAADALGANNVWSRWVAWVISGALMGLGGAIWAEYNLAFDPKSFFFTQTFSLLAMVVVGGVASVSGAVTGAAIITAVTEILRRTENSTNLLGLTQIGVAVIILLVLYLRPEGVLGRWELDDFIGRRLRARGSPKGPEPAAAHDPGGMRTE